MATGLAGADIVMMLRLQRERMARRLGAERARVFPLLRPGRAKLAYAKPDALVMHPGPMNRGVEIDSDVADDPVRSVIREQVEMGVAVRMAVLDALSRHAVAGMTAVMRDSSSPNVRAARPGQRPGREGGLLVRDGRIADIGRGASGEPDDADVIDGDGLVLCPGLVDMRVCTRRARRRISRDHRLGRARPRPPAASPPWPRCPIPSR